MPNNIRIQPLYLPNAQDPSQFNVAESDWRYPGMIGGSCTIILGAGTSADPKVSKTVQLVRTDSAMTTAPFNGATAWWKNRLTYQTTTDPTARRGQVAGVYMGAITPGRLAIVQTGGRHPVVKFVDAPVAAPTTAGLIVIPSATAAKADCLAAGSASTYPALGVSAGTYDAAGTTCAVDLAVPQVS